MSSSRLILASGSPRRRELLADLVDTFEIRPADVEEDEIGPVDQLAERLASLKARTIAQQCPGDIVLGADTVVALDDLSFAKPTDRDAAKAMLRALRGRTHAVYTAVAVAGAAGLQVATSTSRVRLAELPDGAIDAYVASGRPMDKAGAYAIQDDDVPTVERLEGCYCGVMGLPLWLTSRLLRQAGIDARPPSLERCRSCPERGYGVAAEATSE